MNPVGTIIKHSLLRTFSVICVVAVIGLLALGVKRILYPQKTESYSQIVEEGGTNINVEIYNQQSDFFIGFRIFGFQVGVTKPTVKKMAEVVKEADKIK